MAEHPIQCFVCCKQFQTQAKLREHTWYYQSEIKTLLARLHELLAHHDPEPEDFEPSNNGQDTGRHDNTFGSNEDQELRSPAWTGERDKPSTRQPGPTKRRITENQTPALECPHEDCDAQQKTFKRQQELVRHYTTHIRCNEFCQYCSHNYTQASKYITHKCTTGSDEQQRYTKMRIEAFRADAKRELDSRKRRRASDAADSGPDWPKKCKTIHSDDLDGDMNQFTLPHPPLEGTAAPLGAPSSMPPLRSGDISFTEPVSSDQSAPTSTNDAFQLQLQPAHPLFSPADSGWQNQTLVIPAPLWSTPSDLTKAPTSIFP